MVQAERVACAGTIERTLLKMLLKPGRARGQTGNGKEGKASLGRFYKPCIWFLCKNWSAKEGFNQENDFCPISIIF